MKSGRGASACALALLLILAPASEAQTRAPSMPSTLRYGSGLLDVPVAGVLPHLAVTGTLSGFFVKLDRRVEVDPTGAVTGYGEGVEAFYGDASAALGLFDLLEVGATVQSLNATAQGGPIWGPFGRLQVVAPGFERLGLAAGFRYVTTPDFGDGIRRQPGRLGFPDERIRAAGGGAGGEVATNLSLYGVVTAHVPGWEAGPLPRHDLTFSAGFGTGMFRSGGALPFYAEGPSEGWFFGSSAHLDVGDGATLALMGEFNGFDVNVGAQLDVGGVRVGGHVLGVNHAEPAGGYASEYRTPKVGLLASVAFCPSRGRWLCRPTLGARRETDVVQLPAPPPDTVVIQREVAPPPPEGTAARVCLATGEEITVRVTAQGDTLVGPGRVPLSTLGSGVAFAGVYAAGAAWYADGRPIVAGGRSYHPVGDPRRMACAGLAPAGAHEGVPLYAPAGRGAAAGVLFVPTRPGMWHAYREGGDGEGEEGSPPRGGVSATDVPFQDAVRGVQQGEGRGARQLRLRLAGG